MEFKSIPAILRFSISKEEASVQFYRDMVSKTVNPATKSLFEVLIQKEQGHIASLQLEIEKLGHTLDSGNEAIDPPFHWEEQLDTEYPILNMSFADALLLAIQKERAAFRLYAKLLATVRSEPLSQVLLELAEEEMRHVLQLEKEYETIMHRKG